jgi:DHA2 family multidrug resistance protein
LTSRTRFFISASLILGALMQAMDITIANVALPYMQGSLSASQDEIAWVLTSYLVTAAIMTPPTGFLANRFGIRRVFLVSIGGFIIASMLCGAADSLIQIVVFRCLQGAFGASLIPLAQTVLFNINPPERQGRAMGSFTMVIMVAPAIGPVIGGLVTSDFSWRAVFYLNLPLGGLAFIGALLFLPETKSNSHGKLDWLGFGMLSLAIGGLQMLLDRGTEQDWFSSREIIIETVITGTAFYLFLAHICTTQKPFIRPALFANRSFSAATILVIGTGITTFAAISLQPPFLQGLANEPIVTAGLVMGPRGVGTFVSVLLTGRLIGKLDDRLILLAGLIVTSWAFYMMSGWTQDVATQTIMFTGLIQGLGTGAITVPLTTLALSAILPEHRPEASSVFSLARTIGSSLGVSIVNGLFTDNVQINHAEISSAVTAFNRPLAPPHIAAFWSPFTAGGRAALDAVITQQAQIIAYNDDYRLLMILSLFSIPLLFIIGKPRRQPDPSKLLAE